MTVFLKFKVGRSPFDYETVSESKHACKYMPAFNSEWVIAVTILKRDILFIFDSWLGIALLIMKLFQQLKTRTRTCMRSPQSKLLQRVF